MQKFALLLTLFLPAETLAGGWYFGGGARAQYNWGRAPITRGGIFTHGQPWHYKSEGERRALGQGLGDGSYRSNVPWVWGSRVYVTRPKSKEISPPAPRVVIRPNFALQRRCPRGSLRTYPSCLGGALGR